MLIMRVLHSFLVHHKLATYQVAQFHGRKKSYLCNCKQTRVLTYKIKSYYVCKG